MIPHAQVVGTLASAGFDFVLLDCEHGGYDFAALEAAIAACELAGASPLVRAPGADAFFIQRALDLGADGIVVPQIGDDTAAARAVSMAHFAPLGTRGYNPFTRAGNFGMTPQPKLAAGFPFTGVLVESPAAAEALDRIAALPQLDFVYLGVYDYSVALGIPGRVDDRAFRRSSSAAARICRDAGKAVGDDGDERRTGCAARECRRQRARLRNRYLVDRQAARDGLALYANAPKRTT